MNNFFRFTLLENQGQLRNVIEVRNIYGIFGIIKLLAGNYLIVITDRTLVGEINGKKVWKVASTQLVSYKKTTLHMTDDQDHHNKMYISLVEHALGIESYYFSYDYDLTHTLQRLDNTSPDFLSMCLAERADARFVWNRHLLKDFHRDDLSSFALPLMLGFVDIKQVVIKNHCFNYILISRRSCHRAGTR